MVISRREIQIDSEGKGGLDRSQTVVFRNYPDLFSFDANVTPYKCQVEKIREVQRNSVSGVPL